MCYLGETTITEERTVLLRRGQYVTDEGTVC